jgi:hypothetical protein
MTPLARRSWPILVCLVVVCAGAKADESVPALFATASTALVEGRAGDAVAAFEALADRGVVDPVASYDRGLAYALRVRVGAEQPGDLGRAAHGFEEARGLSRDPKLVDDASRALTVVRSEVARRRLRGGQPPAVEPGRSFGYTVAGLLSEDSWAVLSALASFVLAAALFVRWLAPRSRLTVSASVMCGVAAPVVLLGAAMTLAVRHDRLGLREGVVVGPARPLDERGLTVAGDPPLPEGARVELVDAHGGLQRVRFGTVDVWLPAEAIRELAARQ